MSMPVTQGIDMKIETANLMGGIVTVCFVGTWIVLGIAGFFLFYFGKDAAFKRKWFPRYIVLVGVLFVFFVATQVVVSSGSLGGLGILVVIVPAVFAISYMNIRTTKFCNKCGTTLINMSPFSPMKFCFKCGAELDAKPAEDNRLE
jgi:hypothetical protein